MSSNTFTYDANGNMTTRTVGGQTYNLTYNAENQLVSVSGAATASFLYDGDGAARQGHGGRRHHLLPQRLLRSRGRDGQEVLLRGCAARRHDRRFGHPHPAGRPSWQHRGHRRRHNGPSGHPGEVRYRAFGASRFTSGITPTTFRYTGQREEASIGLYYYGARWYDPALGHFVQPDTIIPNAGNALDCHRYGYARFNPFKYDDPSGHRVR